MFSAQRPFCAEQFQAACGAAIISMWLAYDYQIICENPRSLRAVFQKRGLVVSPES
ncbi:unnamed protein product, partial [Ectocarpus sp. 13 AM-2016]